MTRINIIIDIGPEQFEINLTDDNPALMRNANGALVVKADDLVYLWDRASEDVRRWIEPRISGVVPGGEDGTGSCRPQA